MPKFLEITPFQQGLGLGILGTLGVSIVAFAIRHFTTRKTYKQEVDEAVEAIMHRRHE